MRHCIFDICPEWSALHTVPNLSTTLRAFETTAPPIAWNQPPTNDMDQQNATEQGNGVFINHKRRTPQILEKCRKRVHDELLNVYSKIWRNDDEHTTTRATSDGGTNTSKTLTQTDPRGIGTQREK
jgi:hypothetical protein